ncbi:succinate--CoA ligase subunit alpha [Patescibacteria group bacterium AH-259-L07]|nr:succinate--CoA ligase subunit alpha [Patescibacteria group bacterium AH-259-L07]
MAILIDKKTNVLIQGITGSEGSRASREMRMYGTNVCAGVTPGKGGQRVDGVPVYDTVEKAAHYHPQINASLITVPALAVKDASMEAMFANIPLINILAEHVPVQDSAKVIAWARKQNCQIVGPASVGIISPGRAKIGSIGSGKVRHIFHPGSVGVISKSGGMTAEISVILSNAGIGQSTVIGIGGDQIVGSDFVDMLELFELDKGTKVVVCFGEVGGTYEERIAECVKQKKCTKPIVVIVAGKFTMDLPEGTVLGHAGAIVYRKKGSYMSKVRALRRAGIPIANTLEEIPSLVKQFL